jgi:hypothetical protein
MLVRPLFAALTQIGDFAGIHATAQYGEPGLPPRFVPFYYDQDAPIWKPLFGTVVVVTHNLPKLHEAGVSITVDDALLQAIWAGNVTVWNDTAIQQLNPTLTAHLPYRRITMVYFDKWPMSAYGPKRRRISSSHTAGFLDHFYRYMVHGNLPKLAYLGGVLLGINDGWPPAWDPEPQDYIADSAGLHRIRHRDRHGQGRSRRPEVRAAGQSQRSRASIENSLRRELGLGPLARQRRGTRAADFAAAGPRPPPRPLVAVELGS